MPIIASPKPARKSVKAKGVKRTKTVPKKAIKKPVKKVAVKKTAAKSRLRRNPKKKSARGQRFSTNIRTILSPMSEIMSRSRLSRRRMRKHPDRCASAIGDPPWIASTTRRRATLRPHRWSRASAMPSSVNCRRSNASSETRHGYSRRSASRPKAARACSPLLRAR